MQEGMEYCKDLECDLLNSDGEACDMCGAYQFNQWLKSNGYVIVKKKEPTKRVPNLKELDEHINFVHEKLEKTKFTMNDLYRKLDDKMSKREAEVRDKFCQYEEVFAKKIKEIEERLEDNVKDKSPSDRIFEKKDIVFFDGSLWEVVCCDDTEAVLGEITKMTPEVTTTSYDNLIALSNGIEFEDTIEYRIVERAENRR